jgi:hypothetical protein
MKQVAQIFRNGAAGTFFRQWSRWSNFCVMEHFFANGAGGAIFV